MKKLITMFVMVFAMFSVFAAENSSFTEKTKDGYTVETEEELAAVKATNETMIFVRPIVDVQKVKVLSAYDEKNPKEFMNQKGKWNQNHITFEIAPFTSTKICAAADGKVMLNTKRGEITIYHGNKIYSRYSGLVATSLKVHNGQIVKAGQILGSTVKAPKKAADGSSYCWTFEVLCFSTKFLLTDEKTMTLPVHFMIDGKLSTVTKDDMF